MSADIAVWKTGMHKPYTIELKIEVMRMQA